MRESIQVFRGIRPRVGAALLEPNEAQQASMVKIHQGHLRPWFNQLIAKDDTITGQLVRTIYLYLSQYWLIFDADVDIVRGPIASDTENKLYYTGDGIPKKTNEDEATTGPGDKPVNFYPMGVPVPAQAPVAVLGGGGTGDARVVGYVWTVVTSWGEEGAPSAASNLVTALQGQTVTLSDMSLDWSAARAYTEDDWVVPTVLADHVYKCVQPGTSGGAEPTWGTVVDQDTADGTTVWRAYKKAILYDSGGGKRIYRINTGDVSAQYQFVDQIPMASAGYVDSKLDTDLAEVLSTSGWIGPPDNMIGLVSIGRWFAGFVGKNLYFSEPNYPHAWPSAYQITLDFPIVGLGTIGNILVVGTEENPYVVYGTDPSVMQPQKFPDPHPCLSKRGMASIPQGVLFPTTDGLYLCGPTDGMVTSYGQFTREEWQAVLPHTMSAEVHDSKYFCFYTDGIPGEAGTRGGLCMQVANGLVEYVTELDFYASAQYNDETTDTMYYIPEVLTARILEAGTPYPVRSGQRLIETGAARLLE